MLDAVKLIENTCHFICWNTRTAIGNTQDYLSPLAPRAYIYGRLWRCVAHSIFDEIGEHLIQVQIVNIDQ
jgi:hypothetical protein